ncbi:hypothetical protein CO610_08070 [Lysobacteraceae bacterium NML95-0200]|nr:hypothetical protein CO610_08070 [Xanthomonadaceae bacterium NML95-0200]
MVGLVMGSQDSIRYFPRKDLVETIHGLLTSGLTHALTMFAGRRMGKTLFVKQELLPAAETWRWRAYYIDLWVRRDNPELGLVEELEGFVEREQTLKKPDKLLAKAGYGSTGIQAEWSGASNLEIDLQGRLKRAMRALVGQGNESVLLVVDEFQTLAAGKHEDFVSTFRATMQELQLRLKLFFYRLIARCIEQYVPKTQSTFV